MRGGAFFNGKEGRDDFRKTSFWLKGDGGIRKTFFNGKEGRVGFQKDTPINLWVIEVIISCSSSSRRNAKF